MAITHSITVNFTDGTSTVRRSVSQSFSAASCLNETVNTGETNKECKFICESTSLKSFYISSTQDVTVKTNSSGAPQETFTLLANKPQYWQTGMGTAPIAGDVTTTFVTNASGTAADIIIFAGWDATP